MIESWVKITPSHVVLNGERLAINSVGQKLLVDVYRSRINDYPKFFKMDALCKLGFVASELLLDNTEGKERKSRDDRAVIMFNHSSSLNADLHYQATIRDKDNFFPSPSIFVYTLPNIVTGEIAIRNKYYGETSFYVLDSFDADVVARIVCEAFIDNGTTSVLCGWVDYVSDDEFMALLFLVHRNVINSHEELENEIRILLQNENLIF